MKLQALNTNGPSCLPSASHPLSPNHPSPRPGIGSHASREVALRSQQPCGPRSGAGQQDDARVPHGRGGGDVWRARGRPRAHAPIARLIANGVERFTVEGLLPNVGIVLLKHVGAVASVSERPYSCPFSPPYPTHTLTLPSCPMLETSTRQALPARWVRTTSSTRLRSLRPPLRPRLAWEGSLPAAAAATQGKRERHMSELVARFSFVGEDL
jgi:hypothetical protein